MAPDTFDIIGLLLLGAGIWLWFDSLKAREAGIAASRAACRAEGLLFLDDTVAIASLWPARDDYGQLRLRRIYGFEYSDTGDNRRKGRVVLLGDEVLDVNLGRPRTYDQPPAAPVTMLGRDSDRDRDPS